MANHSHTRAARTRRGGFPGGRGSRRRASRRRSPANLPGMTPSRALAAALAPMAAALLLALPAAASVAPSEAVARGDAAWERRAEGHAAGEPRPQPVLDAIDAYAQALEARPGDLEARWKLLQALHFSVDFVKPEPDVKTRRLERAKDVAAEGLERLGEGADGPPLHEILAERGDEALRAAVAERGLPAGDVARLYFWSAIAWGAWGRDAGLLSLVREGVAGKLRDHARTALALDPAVEGGGSQRLLGRLHATLPQVPFISGWVDRGRAVPLLERALEVAPAHPGNPYLLGATLLDLDAGPRERALALLRRAARAEPRPDHVIEDLEVRELALERLAEETGGREGAATRTADGA